MDSHLRLVPFDSSGDAASKSSGQELANDLRFDLIVVGHGGAGSRGQRSHDLDHVAGPATEGETAAQLGCDKTTPAHAGRIGLGTGHMKGLASALSPRFSQSALPAKSLARAAEL
jgi:hypothetical protein